MGDEAVVSAAARTLARSNDIEVRKTLLKVAYKHPVPGILDAIGELRVPEAIPLLVKQLADDIIRDSAFHALKKIGPACLPTLAKAALCAQMGQNGRETPSSLIRRRHALRLIIELGEEGRSWPSVAPLTKEPDLELAALALRIGLAGADFEQRTRCAAELVRLIELSSYPLSDEIQQWLIDHFAIARPAIDQALQNQTKTKVYDLRRKLLRVKTFAMKLLKP